MIGVLVYGNHLDMRYSLDARLRGCLLGAVVGEHQANQRWGKQSYSSSTIFLRSCCLIVESGGEDFQHWWEDLEPELLTLNSENSEREDLEEIELIVLSSLPIGLFFHDNLEKLRSHLNLFTSGLTISPVARDWVYIFGYTLALFLREERQLEKLLPSLLDAVAPSDEMTAVMMLINSWLQKNTRLSSINQQLNQAWLTTHTKMAIALYCLLSSGEDIRLSIIRATGNNDSVRIATIVGALSGAYNSEVAIPLEWYLEIANQSLDGERTSNYAQVLELANALLASWAGVYVGDSIQSDFGMIASVASPGIMRLR